MALAQRRNVWLLLLDDEPMGALDKSTRRMRRVVDILERVGVTRHGDARSGRSDDDGGAHCGTVENLVPRIGGAGGEIYRHPTTRYSAEFIGSVEMFLRAY
ncbi:hypothetical protein KCP69_20085 [Salmonella enterica subsp. enterica]|nr:hypothetical protein KCP69_20085 [Salmonella enterica subsp. enterica]